MGAVGNGHLVIVRGQEDIFHVGTASPDFLNAGFLFCPLSLTQTNGLLHGYQFINLSLVKTDEGIGPLMDNGHRMGCADDKGGD